MAEAKANLENATSEWQKKFEKERDVVEQIKGNLDKVAEHAQDQKEMLEGQVALLEGKIRTGIKIQN